MEFDLPSEARRLFERAAQLAEAGLAGGAAHAGFDPSGWRAVAELGTFRSAAKSASEHGAIATVAMLEGLGRGGAARGLLFSAGAHLFGCLVPLVRYGGAAQRAAYEEPLRSGALIGALAVSEAGGGSSFENIATHAAAVEGGFRLTGRKTMITNAPMAGLFVVLARQFPERGPLGFTAFLAPRGAPGLSVTPIDKTLGLRGAPMGEVEFDGCFVGADATLGRPGAGLRVFSSAMQWERSCLLAGSLGAAERELAACVAALRDRSGDLLARQAVSHRLARMKLRLEGARLLAYRAAGALEEGREDMALASMAKLAVSEMLVANAEDGLRLRSGAAWIGAPPDFGDALLDAFGGCFASGTTEMQLEILARSLQGSVGAS